MTIAESVLEFLSAFPGLEELTLDCLAEAPGACSVDSVPGREVVKQYHGGGKKKQFKFCLSSRELFGAPEWNKANSEFYESFAAWIADCDKSRSLPELDGDRQALSLRCESAAGPVLVSDHGTARYQVSLCLEYYEP